MTARPTHVDLDALPELRRRVYAGIILVIPILVLIAGEVLARIFYHPSSIDLFKEQTLNGVVYRAIDPGVTSRYFPTLAVQPGTATDLFRATKAPGTIRIFTLGASTTLGYPYMMNGSFPAILRDRLRERFPGRTIEVVNLGVTAVTSHTVLDFGRWCLDQEPDLLVVYAGHNEYYGALGVGSSQFVGSSRWMVRTYLALHHSRLFLALKAAVTGIASSVGTAAENRTGTLMEVMARKTTIPFGSETYRQGLDTYRANIEALLNEAGGRGVPVVLSTLVSNLKDLRPMEPVVPDGWTEDDRLSLDRDMASVDSLVSMNRLDQADAILEKWRSLDSSNASIAYAYGTIASVRGASNDARQWFERARDLDGLRFRAPSELNRIVRTLAARPGVTLADAESVMVARAPHGLIGREFLLEHVHPNVAGYSVIADAVEPPVLAVLAVRGFSASTTGPIDVPINITNVDSIVAAYRIRILVNSWPFTSKGVTLADLSASTWEEELALAYLRKEFTWEVLHVRAAERYERLGLLAEASSEYRALMVATPYNVSPFLRLGAVLQRKGDLSEARWAFEQSLAVEATSTAYLKLGEIAYEEGQHLQAVEFLTEAIRTGQVDGGRIPEIRLAIAVATMRAGDAGRALTLAEDLVAQYPTFQRGTEFLHYLRSGGSRR